MLVPSLSMKYLSVKLHLGFTRDHYDKSMSRTIWSIEQEKHNEVEFAFFSNGFTDLAVLPSFIRVRQNSSMDNINKKAFHTYENMMVTVCIKN